MKSKCTKLLSFIATSYMQKVALDKLLQSASHYLRALLMRLLSPVRSHLFPKLVRLCWTHQDRLQQNRSSVSKFPKQEITVKNPNLNQNPLIWVLWWRLKHLGVLTSGQVLLLTDVEANGLLVLNLRSLRSLIGHQDHTGWADCKKTKYARV